MTGQDGFDFVDDQDAGGHDEELPRRGLRVQEWRARFEAFLRGRYGPPAVVVAVVLAFLIGRALLHERPDGAPPPTPSPTPAGSSTAAAAARAGAAADLPRRTGSDPTRCPGLRCYTSAAQPGPVLTAVHAAFPTARVSAVETIRLVDRPHGNPLWYREVLARAGTATLTLRVQAPAAHGDTPGGNADDDGTHSVTTLDASLAQWFVRAEVVDRSGTGDVLDRLTSLVEDRDLLVT